MAPNIDKEAEHLKIKARKELLGLLEGVSKGETSPNSIADTRLGSGQEELSDRERLDGTAESICPVPDAQGIWSRQSLRAGKWQYRLFPNQYSLPCPR